MESMNSLKRSSNGSLRILRLRHALSRASRVSRSLDKIKDSVNVAIKKGPNSPIIVEWPHRGLLGENWGDKLNPVIVDLISGRKAIPRAEVLNVTGQPVYYVIGSGLGGVTDPNAIIWGTGFLSYDQVPLVRPQRIAAVRGPLSRQKYLKAGIDCPEVYGDPALLYPQFYRPSNVKHHQLGVIAHFREQHLPVFQQLADHLGIKLINILGGLEEVVDDVAACHAIASSSLHGLIVADAYGVPSVWMRASELLDGDYFKFHDYLQSVGRSQEDPVILDRDYTVEEIVDRVELASTLPDTQRLLEVCPFYEMA